jgi:hypothetical protein
MLSKCYATIRKWELCVCSFFARFFYSRPTYIKQYRKLSISRWLVQRTTCAGHTDFEYIHSLTLRNIYNKREQSVKTVSSKTGSKASSSDKLECSEMYSRFIHNTGISGSGRRFALRIPLPNLHASYKLNIGKKKNFSLSPQKFSRLLQFILSKLTRTNNFSADIWLCW